MLKGLVAVMSCIFAAGTNIAVLQWAGKKVWVVVVVCSRDAMEVPRHCTTSPES
jgi:hypothetical protein